MTDHGRRSQRRVLEGALVASVLSGGPSVAHALVSGGGSVRHAAAYGLDATRAIGTLLPPGRPGLVRGAVIHVAISLAFAEALVPCLPRRRSTLWGAAAGAVVGAVNLGVVARRWFPELARLPLGPQIADNAAFGAIVAAVADR